jgi:SpoVK/Ycf46/Vps4 family AAA+-type ATPase
LSHTLSPYPRSTPFTRNTWLTHTEALNSHLERYASWIQDKLGAPRSEWTFVETSCYDVDLVHAIRCKATGVEVPNFDGPAFALSSILGNCEPHPDWIDGTTMGLNKRGRKAISLTLVPWISDTLIKVTFKDTGLIAVYCSLAHTYGPMRETPTFCEYLILSKSNLAVLSDLMLAALKTIPSGIAYFNTWDKGSSTGVLVPRRAWDSLIVEESVLQLVKRDVEVFFERKEWFKKNQLPWSRGYMFHGPPGNGKTSTIKTIMTSHNLDAHTLSLYSEHATDKAMEDVFRYAADRAPSMIVLEDLDRAFPKGAERRTKVSLQCLLNCLDGLGTKEGIITIATANEPTALDKAILKRPGRFDRSVLFDNPTEELRLRYLLLKAPLLSTEDLSQVVQASAGFSYAQMQETYILAGQAAYDRGNELVDIADIEKGVEMLRTSTNLTNKKDGTVGFGLGSHRESIE